MNQFEPYPPDQPVGLYCLVSGWEEFGSDGVHHFNLPGRGGNGLCAFEGCPCRCHQNGMRRDHAYQQKPGRAPDGSFYEFCGICGNSPAWHR